MSIPTIDLSCEDRHELAKNLREVCRTTGFFYLDGHGIETSTIKSVFAQTKSLFALPENEKRALSDKVMSRGYTAMEEERLDPHR